jgi:FkbM family methyltransferase
LDNSQDILLLVLNHSVIEVGILLKKSSVLIDVGANIGVVTFPWAIAPANHIVYGFEPTPPMVDGLCIGSALAANYDGRLHIVEAVLGDKDIEETTIYAPVGREDNSARRSETAQNDVGRMPVKEYKIRQYTLDQFCLDNSIDKITLLKVDTQGSEPYVMAGAERMLREWRIDAIYMENSKGLLKANGIAQDHVWKMMWKHGYEGYSPRATRGLVETSDGPGVVFREGYTDHKAETDLGKYNDLLWMPTGNKTA